MLCNLARAVAITAALLASVPAIAGDETSVKVSYADLNLASANGRAAFDRRIASAIRNVCGPTNQRDFAMDKAARRCASTARESVRPAVELAHRNGASRQLAARDMSVTVAP